MRIVPRAEMLATEWDAFVASQPSAWVWHLSAWLDYLVAAGRTDQSLAVVETGTITAICPALLPVPADDPLPRPVGVFPDCFAVSWPTRGQPEPLPTKHGWITRVIDLSLDETALWAGLRRSSHALIHRAEERYAVHLVPLTDLQDLYTQRPDLPQITPASWACLRRLENTAILRTYGAIGSTGDVVGAAAVYVWKDWAYYGHGRTVGGHGVSHLLQWHIIKTLKAEGWPYYEVGWMAHAGDDDKARAISHFKSFAGGSRWWIPINIPSEK